LLACSCTDPPVAETLNLTFVLSEAVPAVDVNAVDVLAIELSEGGASLQIDYDVTAGSFGDREVQLALANLERWTEFDVQAEARVGGRAIANGGARLRAVDGHASVMLRALSGDAGPAIDAGAPPDGSSPAGCADRVVVTGNDEGRFLFDGESVHVTGSNRCGVLGTPDEFAIPGLDALSGSWLQISSGGGHSCGIHTDGTMSCWGRNLMGELGSGPVGVGVSGPQRVNNPGGDEVWVDVSAGSLFSCGVSSEGRLFCWGTNGGRELGLGAAEVAQTRPTPVDVTGRPIFESIASSVDHSCALDETGRAFCWGSNQCGKSGGGEDAEFVDIPSEVAGPRFAQIASGFLLTCGLTLDDGSLWCFGASASAGRACDGSSTPHCFCNVLVAPTQIDTRRFVDLAMFSGGGCAVGEDGTLACWGSNVYGELANGRTDPSLTPSAINDIDAPGVRFTSISAGSDGLCATTGDRRVLCWGRNQLDTSARCFEPTERHYETHAEPTEICR